MENKYVKSPLNYVGGKYKLLPQIIPLFPSDIRCFIDLFGGGANVSVNVNAETVIYNDLNTHIVDMLEYFASSDTNYMISKIDNIINHYGLSKTNQDGFLRLRDDYNSSEFPHPLMLYMLICYAFNYQIRFNSKGKYNMPFGKNRSSFNDTIRNNFIRFVDRLHCEIIKFANRDFRDFDFSGVSTKDFVYCDPPYYNSIATYNESGGWTKKDEEHLLELLDYLDGKSVRWALSNNLGYGNPVLDKWKDKYRVINLNGDYSNCNYHKLDRSDGIEILIVNY